LFDILSSTGKEFLHAEAFTLPQNHCIQKLHAGQMDAMRHDDNMLYAFNKSSNAWNGANNYAWLLWIILCTTLKDDTVVLKGFI
jgi:hypothetical protein